MCSTESLSALLQESDGVSGLGGLEAQLASNGRDWKQLLHARVHQLEGFLKKAQEECSTLRERYQQLRKDFQFNLAILDERDRELERYDAITARASTVNQNSSVAGDIQTQMDSEKMKWDLQHRIHELEEELNLQRQVKLLSKETETHSLAQLHTIEVLKASKEFCQHIQTQLQHKEQEIKDLTAVKDYRIKELEDELKLMETKLKKDEDNHIRKYEDMVWALKEYNAQLETQCQAHSEQQQKAEKHIVKLQEDMEVLAAQAHCIQEDQQKAMEQKDETIQRFHSEVETIRAGWDKYISQVSSEIVVKDTKIITLQERETKLRTEQERSSEEMEGYKQQLNAGLKRERALEQMQVQVELEWQRRCEDMKAEHYLANEQLIEDLTQARDQAKAELKEKEQELQELTALLRSVHMERDQAIQGLTQNVDSMASEEICRLQKQNNILRAMVTQMRKDVESLSQPHPQAQSQAASPQPIHQGASAQMAIGPPAQSTAISPNSSQAGDLYLEKQANISALTKQEVIGAHIMGQSTQLEEENPYWRRQQVSGLISNGLFENVQGPKSNPPLLHTRLKQAVFCIARLSREKQQLIEMGNRLRGHITTAELKGCFPERDSSTEKLGDQYHTLSALEQLPYQLTTQELQYALRQRAYSLSAQVVPGNNNQGPATKEEHKTTDRPESSKTKDPLLCQLQTPLDVVQQYHSGLSRPRLSSGESLLTLNKLWEILDHELSPSVFSEGESELNKREVAKSGVAGVQPPYFASPQTKAQQRTTPSTPSDKMKTSRSGAPDRISKIRN
ncbi:coiled-coil domain-containing protein 57 [Chaetodon trifascialis]|uniref:coiled-coil domain-containing protein 57 n=1 Tax=Chaetodon trifascialis TaxID=109706 RepID=UPI0039952EC2